jgi:hypothetical protein
MLTIMISCCPAVKDLDDDGIALGNRIRQNAATAGKFLRSNPRREGRAVALLAMICCVELGDGGCQTCPGRLARITTAASSVFPVSFPADPRNVIKRPLPLCRVHGHEAQHNIGQEEGLEETKLTNSIVVLQHALECAMGSITWLVLLDEKVTHVAPCMSVEGSRRDCGYAGRAECLVQHQICTGIQVIPSSINCVGLGWGLCPNLFPQFFKSLRGVLVFVAGCGVGALGVKEGLSSNHATSRLWTDNKDITSAAET